MGLLDLTSSIGASQNVLGAVTGASGAVSNLSGALDQAMSGDIMGAIRSVDLPAAGEAVGDIISAVSTFGGDANPNDWRVRLSLANWSSFKSSPVLQPLKDAGGLIFPYTPTITMNSGAKYDPIPTTHTNFNFQAFKNSDPGTITITAPMNVEDPTQGLYWIAALHYLRSLTKMFAGLDPKAGNPPPIVFLNGYGNYVFKNIPVVVTQVQTTLDDKCDYIGVNVVGSAAGAAQGLADSVGGLAGSLGGVAGSILGPDLGGSVKGFLGGVSNSAGGIGQVAALAGTFGLGGSISGGVSHVPTKSTFVVTLQPIYSRSSARNFSLDRFVQGGYLNNAFGYI